jgi:DNA transformation protein
MAVLTERYYAEYFGGRVGVCYAERMASSQKIIDYITDQIARAGDIRSRKMFGEYALYCNEKVVGLVCNDILYIKITEVGRAQIEHPVEAPPYIGAKPMFQIDDDLLDDREWLTGLVRITADVLPIPAPKKIKKRKVIIS